MYCTRHLLVGGVVLGALALQPSNAGERFVALQLTHAALVWGFASAAAAVSAAPSAELAPIVVAQMQTTTLAPDSAGVTNEMPFPAYQTGVRRAAAQSNEALRRYILRTRRIYDFFFDDFAKKE